MSEWLTYLVKTVSFPFQTKADPDFGRATASPDLSAEPRNASPELPKYQVKADDDDDTKETVKVKKEKVALPPKGRRRYTKKKQEYVETENMSVPIQEVWWMEESLSWESFYDSKVATVVIWLCYWQFGQNRYYNCCHGSHISDNWQYTRISLYLLDGSEIINICC